MKAIQLPIRCQHCRARGFGVDAKVTAHWLCHFRAKKGSPTPRLLMDRFQNTKAKRRQRFAEAVRANGGLLRILP